MRERRHGGSATALGERRGELTLDDLGLRLRSLPRDGRSPSRRTSALLDDALVAHARRDGSGRRARRPCPSSSISPTRSRATAARCPTRSWPPWTSRRWPGCPEARGHADRSPSCSTTGRPATSAPGRRPRRTSTTTSGTRKAASRPRPAAFTLAGRSPRGPGRRPRPRARVPGHHGVAAPLRLGPAVPGRPRNASARRTRTTGTATARPPRPSCPWRRGAGALGPPPGPGHVAAPRSAASGRGARRGRAPRFEAALRSALATRPDGPAPRAASSCPRCGRRRSRRPAGPPTSASTSSTSASSWWSRPCCWPGSSSASGSSSGCARWACSRRGLHAAAPAAASSWARACGSPRSGASSGMPAPRSTPAVLLGPAHDLGGRRRAPASSPCTWPRARSWPAPWAASLAAALAIAWTLRGLLGRSPRALLAGALDDWAPPRRTRPGVVAPRAGPPRPRPALARPPRGRDPAAAAFFGAGALLLAAALVFLRGSSASRPAEAAALPSSPASAVRGASYRPGRSLLCIALVAAAAFVIVAVGAFRRGGAEDCASPTRRAAATPSWRRPSRPLHNDPANARGPRRARPAPEALARRPPHPLPAQRGRGRELPEPLPADRPTVLGATADFLRAGPLRLPGLPGARPKPSEANPWLLLEPSATEGAIPVAVDGNSLAYVLHRKLGDVVDLGRRGVRVRFVAALRPGLFQSELSDRGAALPEGLSRGERLSASS